MSKEFLCPFLEQSLKHCACTQASEAVAGLNGNNKLPKAVLKELEKLLRATTESQKPPTGALITQRRDPEGRLIVLCGSGGAGRGTSRSISRAQITRCEVAQRAYEVMANAGVVR